MRVCNSFAEAGLPARAVIRSTERGGMNPTCGGADEPWLVVPELEVQPANGPTFEAGVEHIVPLLEVPRFLFGEVVQVKYNPQGKTNVAIV